MGLTYSGLSKEKDPTGSALALVFGTLMAILLFFSSVYYIYMVLPKQAWDRFTKRDPFTFARFRNRLQEAASQETLVLETDRPVTDSFANPLYNPDGAALGPLIADSPTPNVKSDELPLQPNEIKADSGQLLLLPDDETTEEASMAANEEDSSTDDEEGMTLLSDLEDNGALNTWPDKD